MRILIAPLDWGLGHATRCIPLIRALEKAGHTVIPCAGGAGLRLLRAEFPHLTVEPLPGHAMRYTKTRALLPLWLFAQLPLFLLGIRRDGIEARRLVRKYDASLVIADGRYGFRAPDSSGIPTVFLSHQIEILPPGPAWLRPLIAPLLRLLNRRALRKFTEVWVPDFAGPENLSGVLGHPAHAEELDLHYLGPLCRFDGIPSASVMPVIPDYLALVSGPEPQRSVFEQQLRVALNDLPGTKVLVCGVPSPSGNAGEVSVVPPGELTVIDHLPGEVLSGLLRDARNVVCRSGYTTVMELAGLRKRNVLLVPTPGQPEQEYLAAHAAFCGFAAWQDQDRLDLVEGFREAAALPGFGFWAVPQVSSDPANIDPSSLDAWVAAHPLLADRA